MNKKTNPANKLLPIAIILSITTIVVIFFPRQKPFHERINDVRQETAPMFDSISNLMSKENDLQYRINLLIVHNDLQLANKIIDSAIETNPTKGIYHTYKGMTYAAEKNYQQALQEYDKSILLTKTKFPLVLSKKAEVFIHLKDYNKAIENYKKAAALNADFNYQIATLFESISKKDSALKYFLIYQKHYPDDQLVMDKIKGLSKD